MTRIGNVIQRIYRHVSDSHVYFLISFLMRYVDFSTEAPPSFLPLRKYCDITGLEVNRCLVSMMQGSYTLFQAPYRDPKTKLRYHDLGVYNYIQNLASGNTRSRNSILTYLMLDHTEPCYYSSTFERSWARASSSANLDSRYLVVQLLQVANIKHHKVHKKAARLRTSRS